MARKLNKNLLALSSAAIVSVYAVGIARTAVTPASAGSSNTAAGTAAAANATQTQPGEAATAIARAIAVAASPTVAAGTTGSGTAFVTSAYTYKDGTFTGTGTSRMGDVSVSVTMKGGQVTAVQITGGTTHYPLSRIAQLPGEVLAAQSTNIKLVSGATYSSQAFKQAVTQALSQAASAA